MSRNPDGSVLALSNASTEDMDAFKWHQPIGHILDGAHQQAATTLASLTPVAPTGRPIHHQHQQHQQQPQNNNQQDVMNMQYIELEEFLLEHSVGPTHTDQKEYHIAEGQGPPHPQGQLPPHPSVHSHEKQYQVNLEQRPPYSQTGPSLANNALQIMPAGELKREAPSEDDHLRLTLTPPEHQNDVVMKIGRSVGRTMSGPPEHSTGTSTILTTTTQSRRTTSLCDTDPSNPPPAVLINSRPGCDDAMVHGLALSPSSSSSSSDNGISANTRNGRGNRKTTNPHGGGARAMSARRLKKEPVPDTNKDEKYWKRRAKNNLAAKRSRDLRREKENAILHRVQYLEGQNQGLNQTLADYKQENAELKERLSQYEAV